MKKKISMVLSAVMAVSAFGGVCVSAEDAPLIEAGVVESYDFEDYEIQEFTQTGYHLDNKLWISALIDGDSISVVEESDGNKALKITRKLENATTGSSKFMFVFDKAYKSKVQVSFDYKIENNNGGCSSFMSLGSSTSNGFSPEINSYIIQNYYYTKLRESDGYNNWGNTSQIGTDWVPMTLTVDMENGKFFGTTYRFYKQANQSTQNREWSFNSFDVPDIKYLCMAAFGSNSGDLNSGRTQDAVYYIDNIKVINYDYPRMSAESVYDGKIVGLNEPVRISFNEALTSDSVAANYFVLEEDGKYAEDYNVLSDDSGKNISVIPQNGWEYGKNYSLSVKNSISAVRGKVHPMYSDYVIKFSTENIIGNINIKDNGRYNGEIKPEHIGISGVKYTYMIKNTDGEYNDYDLSVINELGNYTLKIIAERDGKKQEREIGFTVIGEVVPTAQEVKVSGNTVLGGTLIGEYVFEDENGDKEGTSEYKWLLAETADGEFTEIPGENSTSITLDEKFVDKYVKFEVTPVSLREPSKGLPVTSEAVKGLFRPTAKNVILKKENGKLILSYEYSDENGDTENETEIKWYYQTKENGEYILIEGASSTEYELTDDDDNKYISAAVIPKSSAYPFEGEAVRSNAAAANFAPVASKLEFMGTVKEGQTIGAEYTYFDADGDEEGNSIIKWYINNREVSQGASIYLASSYAGSKIYFTVEPVSASDSKHGEIVKSPERTIEKAGKTISSSSGGGGGRPSGPSVAPPVTTPKPEDTDKKEENNKKGFNDIENHWAKKYIEELYDKNIIAGISDNEYAPEKTLTRAQIAVILQKALNLSFDKKESEFEDVKTDDWYYEGISACSSQGIIKGDNGLFRPNDEITREELCAIIARIFDNDSEASWEKLEFGDKEEISDWAKNAVAIVNKLGIIEGMENGNFCPKQTATRAQTAVIISRLLTAIGGEDDE